MSRTYKTTAVQHRARQRAAWRTEFHDHRNGVCNLGAPDTVELWPPNDGRCAWIVADEPIVTRQVCGCALCTAQPWRRAERRRTRHVARRWTVDRRNWTE